MPFMTATSSSTEIPFESPKSCPTFPTEEPYQFERVRRSIMVISDGAMETASACWATTGNHHQRQNSRARTRSGNHRQSLSPILAISAATQRVSHFSWPSQHHPVETCGFSQQRWWIIQGYLSGIPRGAVNGYLTMTNYTGGNLHVYWLERRSVPLKQAVHLREAGQLQRTIVQVTPIRPSRRLPTNRAQSRAIPM